MADTSTKRRREKYSKLICLGCRARRIRCILPDTSIEPSSEPQPSGKACQRCSQNGLDCVVDFTTLGRPAQKRSRIDHDNSNLQPNDTTDKTDQHVYETSSQDVEGFLLAQPETSGDAASVVKAKQQRTSKREIAESMTSAYHLLAVLLSRDRHFASSIVSQPSLNQNVVELIDDATTTLLDAHLIWHKLYHPDIPSLATLREEVRSMSHGQAERISSLYLLTLLCDVALDVPSPRLASVRHLQPAVRAMTFHCGQQLLFTLHPNKYTMLALSLTSEYRPLALTSSQTAGAHALKAVPNVIVGKYIAMEMDYQRAGLRLTQALNDFDADQKQLKTLMHECLHWIWLNIAEDMQGGPFNEWKRHMDPSALECLEALHTAVWLNRLPSELILPYCSISYWTQMLANLRDMTEHWKDLDHLGQVIQGHRVFCDKEVEMLNRLLEQCGAIGELAPVISQIADMERHLSHTTVVGAALFFAVMCGAFAMSHHGPIQSEQAVQVSDNIISQLTSHEGSDPTRPSHRRFLEQYGETRMDELERFLTNYITTADNLTLKGIRYVGPTRSTVGWVIMICKDIVEGQAARLKGWGGLHERVDTHMILFSECAKRLEAMSASAGSADALAKGCVLTAAARLVRSLHRILQGFKKTAATSQRRSATESTKSDPTPPSLPDDLPGMSNSITNVSSDWENIFADDLFSNWDNWPQFDSMDFSDLFGEVFDFEQAGF